MIDNLEFKKVSKDFFYCFYKGVIPVLVVMLISSVLYQQVIKFIISETTISNFSYSILSASVPTIFYGVFILLYIYFFNKKNLIHTSGFHRSMIQTILISVTVLLSFNVLITLIFELLEIKVGTNSIIELGDTLDPIYFIYLIPIMILFVGPVEEIMVRGVIQGNFRKKFTKNQSIIITSSIFGLLHIISVDGFVQTISYVLSTAILSIILGYIYERTESITVPSIVHGLYNSALVTGLYISEIGIL